ncbi:unnamed protein product [Sphenostylis stenocarpa]|uniref:Uncharacterized protein n=1 Tax=Sphenostylis stenocarpa TaxID=92480 RepID=A0AA86SRT5_9FABA|nr:unnamed protein product [Sphenostylis stenocarpa]
MWNCCLRNNLVAAQDENEEGKKVEKMKTFSCGMKKRVRFKIEDGGSRSGLVRIRLVGTKGDLKRLLRNKNENESQHTSLEQLLRDMMLREKRVSGIEKYCGSINSWKPVLESIPEDRSMM